MPIDDISRRYNHQNLHFKSMLYEVGFSIFESVNRPPYRVIAKSRHKLRLINTVKVL